MFQIIVSSKCKVYDISNKGTPTFTRLPQVNIATFGTGSRGGGVNIFCILA